jgi:acetoacetyl-CoA synthetase
VQVAEIPRTKSGKIVELAVRDVIHGREVKKQGGARESGGAGVLSRSATELRD